MSGIFAEGEDLQASATRLSAPGGFLEGPETEFEGKSHRALGLPGVYFHSQILETVLPALSTSYSKAPHAWFRRASFCELVLKNSIPR